jgi:hypothetical protein
MDVCLSVVAADEHGGGAGEVLVTCPWSARAHASASRGSPLAVVEGGGRGAGEGVGDWDVGTGERGAGFAVAGVYVLPARFGDSELPGLLPDLVCVAPATATPRGRDLKPADPAHRSRPGDRHQLGRDRGVPGGDVHRGRFDRVFTHDKQRCR